MRNPSLGIDWARRRSHLLAQRIVDSNRAQLKTGRDHAADTITAGQRNGTTREKTS